MDRKGSPSADAAAPGARSKSSQSFATNKETIAAPQAPSDERPIYVLRVRFLRGSNEVGRLRAILKMLLRQHAVRCLSIEPEART
jgi:hypothetical protein